MIHEENIEQHLKVLLKRNPGLSKIAISKEEIIGCVLASYNGFRGYIFRLVVHKDHRRQGVGKKLINACEEDLKKFSMPKLTLNCRKELVPWYKEQGFNVKDAVYLSKEL